MESSEDQFNARLANLNINQGVDYVGGAEPNTPSTQVSQSMGQDLQKSNSMPVSKGKSKLDNYKILKDLGEGAYG